jgi:hypothetical protein
MSRKRILTLKQARTLGEQLGIRWDKFDLEQFRVGLGVELEHGIVNPTTNVTNDDPLMTGKIALAHLTEFPDYYTRLAKLEEEAKRFWDSKKLKKTISGSKNVRQPNISNRLSTTMKITTSTTQETRS